MTDPHYTVRPVESRKGNWMQTYTGRMFWPLDPRVDEIDIIDIAHALSHQPRFAGHTLRFMSVAEHCFHVAEAVEPQFKKAALLHDGSEAYMIDVPRPIKQHLSNYREIEDGISKVIAERFRVAYPWPPEVVLADNRILLDERHQNMRWAPTWTRPDGWAQDLEPLGVTLKFWTPEVAKDMFLGAFYVLG